MKEKTIGLRGLAITAQTFSEKLCQIPQSARTYRLDFLVARLECAEAIAFPAQQSTSLIAKKIPFDEIFSLLKDSYFGKGNQYMQEILDDVEVELSVNKKFPDDPDSARQLEINIKLAAAVIDKYADLLQMVVGQKVSKKDAVLIEQSKQTLKELNHKLNRINIIYAITALKESCLEFRDAHRASHCFPFFCSGKAIARLNAVEDILNNLIQPGLATAEMMGGLIRLDNQLHDKIENQKHRNALHQAIEDILTSNDSLLIEHAQMSEAYRQRAEVLGLDWPAPFDINAPDKATAAAAMMQAS